MPAENDKTSYVVGVDFGGTKILAGVFDEKFNCIGRARVSTKADRGVDEVIGRIARSVREARIRGDRRVAPLPPPGDDPHRGCHAEEREPGAGMNLPPPRRTRARSRALDHERKSSRASQASDVDVRGRTMRVA